MAWYSNGLTRSRETRRPPSKAPALAPPSHGWPETWTRRPCSPLTSLTQPSIFLDRPGHSRVERAESCSQQFRATRKAVVVSLPRGGRGSQPDGCRNAAGKQLIAGGGVSHDTACDGAYDRTTHDMAPSSSWSSSCAAVERATASSPTRQSRSPLPLRAGASQA